MQSGFKSEQSKNCRFDQSYGVHHQPLTLSNCPCAGHRAASDSLVANYSTSAPSNSCSEFSTGNECGVNGQRDHPFSGSSAAVRTWAWPWSRACWGVEVEWQQCRLEPERKNQQTQTEAESPGAVQGAENQERFIRAALISASLSGNVLCLSLHAWKWTENMVRAAAHVSQLTQLSPVPWETPWCGYVIWNADVSLIAVILENVKRATSPTTLTFETA